MADPLAALVAALTDAGYALLAGIVLTRVWLRAARSDAPAVLRRFEWLSLSVIVATHLIRPWLIASSMSGSNEFRKNLALVPDVLSSTHPGEVWSLACLALVILIACTATGGRIVTLVPLALLAMAKSASGHGANAGDFTSLEFAMALHLGATAIWAGAVVIAGLVVLPNISLAPNQLWAYGNTLSRWVAWALLAVLVSGLFVTYGELDGCFRNLWQGAWGRVLLAKGVMVVVALALGATARFRCLRQAPNPENQALFLHVVRIEAMVMLGILVISGVLANTPPAAECSGAG